MKTSKTGARVADIVPFGLRLAPELKWRVEAAAKANARSLNSEIAVRLEQSFQLGHFDAACEPNDVARRLSRLEGRMTEVEARLDGVPKSTNQTLEKTPQLDILGDIDD